MSETAQRLNIRQIADLAGVSIATVSRVLNGREDVSEETRGLVAEVTTNRFLPNHVLAVSSPGDEASSAAVALLRDRPQRDGRATAYVCERFECLLPVTDPAALAAQVGGTPTRG